MECGLIDFYLMVPKWGHQAISEMMFFSQGVTTLRVLSFCLVNFSAQLKDHSLTKPTARVYGGNAAITFSKPSNRIYTEKQTKFEDRMSLVVPRCDIDEATLWPSATSQHEHMHPEQLHKYFRVVGCSLSRPKTRLLRNNSG